MGTTDYKKKYSWQKHENGWRIQRPPILIGRWPGSILQWHSSSKSTMPFWQWSYPQPNANTSCDHAGERDLPKQDTHSHSWGLYYSHAPYKHYSLNLTDMHTEQGIQHILAALQFRHSSDNLTGKLIQGSTKTRMLELGMPENPFQLDYNILHLLATNMWIKTLWQFQHQHSIQIEIDLPKLNTAWMNDQFLMTNFVQMGISGAKLVWINQCRLYLQVTMLVNIWVRGIY